MTPDDIAKACADTMWSTDSASKGLGFEIKHVSAGKSEMTMVVREEMLNGQRICHGGFIFTLADSAFAFACNGYNQFAVAQSCKIDFLAPAFEGDVLTAIAEERFRENRSGIYDVRVCNQDGKIIAEMRGNSRTVKGTHLPEDIGEK